jgi:hypothetical protein
MSLRQSLNRIASSQQTECRPLHPHPSNQLRGWDRGCRTRPGHGHTQKGKAASGRETTFCVSFCLVNVRFKSQQTLPAIRRPIEDAVVVSKMHIPWMIRSGRVLRSTLRTRAPGLKSRKYTSPHENRSTLLSRDGQFLGPPVMVIGVVDWRAILKKHTMASSGAAVVQVPNVHKQTTKTAEAFHRGNLRIGERLRYSGRSPLGRVSESACSLSLELAVNFRFSTRKRALSQYLSIAHLNLRSAS